MSDDLVKERKYEGESIKREVIEIKGLAENGKYVGLIILPCKR